SIYGVPTFVLVPSSVKSTLSNVIFSPGLVIPMIFSTRKTLSAVTTYCFPPVSMIAIFAIERYCTSITRHPQVAVGQLTPAVTLSTHPLFLERLYLSAERPYPISHNDQQRCSVIYLSYCELLHKT